MVTSEAKPSALATLFFKAYRSEFRFVRGDDGVVVLHSGGEKARGKNEFERSFRVDYDAGEIHFRDGKVDAISNGESLEAAAFPLVLMLRPIDEIAGLRVREVSAKRSRGYVYDAPVAEQITLADGEFMSWKIRRYRADKPDDSVTVWLRQSDHIPLQITARKRGKTSTLRLLN